MRHRRFLLAAVLSLMASASVASAKDMANRLGVGYSNQFGLDRNLPSLAVHYYPNANYSIMGALGINTEKDNSLFGLGAKVMKVVFKEDNLNFYTGAGAGVVSQNTAGSTSSGFEISGFCGAEFFLPGLENLSFSFEAGVGITSISNDVRFRTIGDTPLNAGVMFYF